jgi:hypothetical protein
MEHTPPIYTSVDIRNAGFKLAPVDTNLYPGGWNNLTPEMLPLAVQAAQAAIEKICPEAKNLLIIPENHTRNTFYLTNVAQLQRVFHMAGLNVRLGSINPEIKETTVIELPNGESVVLTSKPGEHKDTFTKETTDKTVTTEGYDNYNSYYEEKVTKTTYYGKNGVTAVVVKGPNGQYLIKINKNGTTYIYGPNNNIYSKSNDYDSYYSSGYNTNTYYENKNYSDIEKNQYKGYYGGKATSVTGPKGNTVYHVEGPYGNSATKVDKNYYNDYDDYY